jgi:hypothetical protein
MKPGPMRKRLFEDILRFSFSRERRRRRRRRRRRMNTVKG